MARYKGINQLSGSDRLIVALMIGVPTLLLVWLACGQYEFAQPHGGPVDSRAMTRMASARSATRNGWG